ncbi:MAG: BtaA family protein [Pirellulales bacterium]|nr:BtaA family protein [Pirellulales bacterium]
MIRKQISDRVAAKSFAFVHQHNLVYNTCWEDPRLDREALCLGPQDDVLVITSAGCNALDYVLAGARRVYAVDLNFRQNALLERKLAGIRRLDYAAFFELFGQGQSPRIRELYADVLRAELSPRAQRWWDKRLSFFRPRGWRKTFYFRGTSGFFARMINEYIDRVVGLRDEVQAMLDAPCLAAQQELYARIRDVFWSGLLRWLVRRDATLSLLGVPRPQREHLERTVPGGIAGFVEDCVDAVFGKLPLADNYFWRVYLTGSYTPACCPEYLKPENFARLQAGLVDRVSTHTTSVCQFLRHHEQPISRFVLLDHMDWLAAVDEHALQEEWQSIVDRATPGARFIWRSGGLETVFVDRQVVRYRERRLAVGELLSYDRALAARLHPFDRVHTYGSFHIAEFPGARDQAGEPGVPLDVATPTPAALVGSHG